MATTIRQWAQARGRTFPLPTAEQVPWWIVVLLVLGLVIFYSVTTSETLFTATICTGWSG